MSSRRGKWQFTCFNDFLERLLSYWGRSADVVFVVTMVLFGTALVSAQSRHIELNDLAKIVSVADPQISPDGKRIVIVVSRANLEQDRNERELVQVDIASRAQHALTYERKTVGSPRWSPSGDRLAFIANEGAGKDAKPQIFVLSMSGGEARKISDAPGRNRRSPQADQAREV